MIIQALYQKAVINTLPIMFDNCYYSPKYSKRDLLLVSPFLLSLRIYGN